MDKLKEKAVEILGRSGKMISGSKGLYRYHNPNNLTVFNSNVCLASGKLWHGDLDITEEEGNLRKLASELGETVYVLLEMDGRSFNIDDKDLEENPKTDKAVYYTDGTEEGSKLGRYDGFYERRQGVILQREETEEEKEENEKRRLESLKEAASEYKQEDYPIKLKLPELEEFAVFADERNEDDEDDEDEDEYYEEEKKSSPYHLFWKWVDTQLDRKEDELYNICAFRLDNASHDKMEEICVKWMEDVHHLSGYMLEKNKMWYLFDIAPSAFPLDPEWAEPGHLYVKKKYLEATRD